MACCIGLASTTRGHTPRERGSVTTHCRCVQAIQARVGWDVVSPVSQFQPHRNALWEAAITCPTKATSLCHSLRRNQGTGSRNPRHQHQHSFMLPLHIWHHPAPSSNHALHTSVYPHRSFDQIQCGAQTKPQSSQLAHPTPLIQPCEQTMGREAPGGGFVAGGVQPNHGSGRGMPAHR
jgi:hypothetical protein